MTGQQPVGGARGGAAAALTAGEIAAAVGGRLLAGSPAAVVDGFSIDTRTISRGQLYIAIKGERFDGHDFVEQALEAGSCGAIVSRPAPLTPAALAGRLLIAVGDTTTALQLLARWIRRRSGARVVAITGSAGKTTTKEIAATFLSLQYEVMRSGGNLNNHIGLPLSLLELRHGAPVAVVELGMNHAGEISRLVSIAEPDVRVWMNVAEVHTEFFDSIEAIAEAKAEILEGASAGTVLVANADDARVAARVGRFPGKLVTFSVLGTHATVNAGDVEDLGLDGTRATVRTPSGDVDWRVPLPGRTNLMNSLAALAVGLEFGVPLEAMAERVRTLTPASRRGEVVRLQGGITVVDDAYNSNPRALIAALAVVGGEERCTRRGAVLGEMLELGASSEALHEECGRAAAAAGLAWLIGVGGPPAAALVRAAVAAGLPAAAARHVATSEEAAQLAADTARDGDLVLVKGSRGIRTERVVERLKAAFGPERPRS